MNQSDIAIIIIVWMLISLCSWGCLTKWIFRPSHYVVGHIIFAISTLPFTMIVILLFILLKLFDLFLYICSIKLPHKF